jgi:hypothetical protein
MSSTGHNRTACVKISGLTAAGWSGVRGEVSMTTDDGVRQAVAAWLQAAVADAEHRGLPELVPLLEGLAKSTIDLRTAGWNDQVSAAGEASGNAPEGGR